MPYDLIGVKKAKYSDPSTRPEELDRLIKRGNLKAYSNPNISEETFERGLVEAPLELEQNPVFVLKSLESPENYKETVEKLYRGIISFIAHNIPTYKLRECAIRFLYDISDEIVSFKNIDFRTILDSAKKLNETDRDISFALFNKASSIEKKYENSLNPDSSKSLFIYYGLCAMTLALTPENGLYNKPKVIRLIRDSMYLLARCVFYLTYMKTKSQDIAEKKHMEKLKEQVNLLKKYYAEFNPEYTFVESTIGARTSIGGKSKYTKEQQRRAIAAMNRREKAKGSSQKKDTIEGRPLRFSKEQVEAALIQAGYSTKIAAEILGCSYDTITRSAKAYGLRVLTRNDPEYKEMMSMVYASPEFKERKSAALKKAWEDPTLRERVSTSQKKTWENPEHRQRVSESIKKVWENSEHRQRMSASQREMWQDPEYQRRVTETNRKTWEDPELRQQASESAKRFNADPGRRQRTSVRSQAMWADPVRRQELIKLLHEGWDNMDEDKREELRLNAKLRFEALSPEQKRKVMTAMRRREKAKSSKKESDTIGGKSKYTKEQIEAALIQANYSIQGAAKILGCNSSVVLYAARRFGLRTLKRTDPEYKQAQSEAMKQRWEDPAYRQNSSEKASELMKQRWEDPTYRQEISEQVSEDMKRRWKNPEYRQKKSLQISTSLKQKWEDPAYRQNISEQLSEAMKQRWEDPAYRQYRSKLTSDYMKKHWEELSEEERENISVEAKIRWDAMTPEQQRRALSAMNTREKTKRGKKQKKDTIEGLSLIGANIKYTKEEIEDALIRSGHSASGAARILNSSPAAVTYAARRFGIKVLTMKDPEYKEMMAKIYNDPARRALLSDIAKTSMADSNRRERMRAAAKKAWENPELLQKKSQHIKELWATPEYREKTTESMREAWDSDPERRQEYSLRTKKQWEDPAFRELTSSALKQAWDDPVRRSEIIQAMHDGWAAMSEEDREKFRETKRQHWDALTPEQQQRVIAAMRYQAKGQYKKKPKIKKGQ